jgi:hypothetical protein
MLSNQSGIHCAHWGAGRQLSVDRKERFQLNQDGVNVGQYSVLLVPRQEGEQGTQLLVALEQSRGNSLGGVSHGLVPTAGGPFFQPAAA